jgi:hypothetical protein
MNKNVQITVAVVLAAVLIIYVYQTQVNTLNASLAQASRPIFINQNYISVNYSPSTTNIENVDGNGHAIGDGNSVQNEVA